MPVPGAGFETEGSITPSLEVGVFLRGGFALAVSGMAPTTTPNMATGTIAAFGNLGDETVGFYSATAQYHFPINEVFRPYVGAGVGYMHVFDNVDGAVTNMDIESAFGGVAQAGVDIALNDSLRGFRRREALLHLHHCQRHRRWSGNHRRSQCRSLDSLQRPQRSLLVSTWSGLKANSDRDDHIVIRQHFAIGRVLLTARPACSHIEL